MNKREYKNLYQTCSKIEDGPDYQRRYIDNYALNLINTAIDFQMNGVKEAECFYLENIGYKSHKYLKGEVEYFPNTKKGNTRLAQYLWDRKLWTRAEFLRLLIREFEKRKIRGPTSLAQWVRRVNFKDDVKYKFRTDHHSIGPAIFYWLRLKCGDDTVKPDTHILKFVSDCIGRRSNPDEAVESLTKIASRQNRNAFLLDSAIWHFQRSGGRVRDLL